MQYPRGMASSSLKQRVQNKKWCSIFKKNHWGEETVIHHRFHFSYQDHLLHQEFAVPAVSNVLWVVPKNSVLDLNYDFLHSGYKWTSTGIGTERRVDKEALWKNCSVAEFASWPSRLGKISSTRTCPLRLTQWNCRTPTSSTLNRCTLSTQYA